MNPARSNSDEFEKTLVPSRWCERSRQRVFAFVIAFTILLFLAACDQKDEASTHKPSPASPTSSPSNSNRENELVRLTAKRITRQDRPDPAEADFRGAFTTLPSPTPAPEVIGLEPGTDWQSESLSEFATNQLERLLHEWKGSALAEIVSPTFRGSLLQPQPLATLFAKGELTVRRAQDIDSTDYPIGRDAFADALSALLALSPDSEPRVAIKPIGIDLGSDPDKSFTVLFLVQIDFHDDQAGLRRQIKCEWRSRWTAPANNSDEKPRLEALQVLRFEEATLARPEPLFVDATPSVLGATPHFETRVMRGIEHWSQRLTRFGDMYLTGHHGLAIGDVNGDGLEDLYACDGGSLPNRLYLQNPDGTVRDASVASGVDFLEDSRGALLIDLDNDGDQDLVVATVAMILFLENDGTGRFTIRGGHMGAPYPASLCAADYDHDRDLDLYVCIYEAGDLATGSRWFEARTPVPFHDANNGGRNVLLENLGGFAFRDATDEVGLDQNNRRWSFAAAWEDFDQDGDPDLYVANDFGRNNLYRNDLQKNGRRTFVDVASSAGVEDMAAGMSVAWGDVNRDGLMDLYVGNMFSSAGNRTSYQRHFAQGRDAAALSGTQRMARGNSLFLSASGGTRFSDVSHAAGVTMGRWAWSSGFADINNDGWEDLVVANGYLTQTRDHDL